VGGIGIVSIDGKPAAANGNACVYITAFLGDIHLPYSGMYQGDRQYTTI
jgi:uncharacterized Zn-binding protein involved in type VI secretion